MKFQPVEKITQPKVSSTLRKHFPGAEGTAIYLELMRKLKNSMMELKATPVERLLNVWVCLFFVRAWRNWCVMKFKSIENCVTTNCYWGMEINGHALINYIILFKDKDYVFDITLLQSQACESFFCTCRSSTSTESTVVNFDMHSFESRLNKIEAKIEITHKRKDDFKFQRLKETDANFRLQLPSNINIVEIVEEAKHQATCLLNIFGIDVTEELFKECIFVRKPKEKRDDHMGNFELVPVYEDIEEVNNVNVCDVEELFTNAGSELQVKDSCSSNDRNTFKIRNRNGKIVCVKKLTFIWMLQSDISRVSTDRLHRFHEAAKVDEMMIFLNETRQNISIGEWILIDCNVLNIVQRRFVCHFETTMQHTQRKLRTTVPHLISINDRLMRHL